MEASFKGEGSVAIGDDRSLIKLICGASAATAFRLPVRYANRRRGRCLTPGRQMEFKSRIPGGSIYSKKAPHTFRRKV